MIKPNIILNFVTYTDVDGSGPNQNIALKINTKEPFIISKYANKN